MDFEQAKQAFELYLNGYDRKDEKVYLKIVHTYGVVDCSEEIARRMGLGEEDIFLAKIIALLHDIGRFEQLKLYDSFEPGIFDHAQYGADILFREGRIREFLPETTWDETIETAIRYHSTAGAQEISERVWEACLNERSVLSEDRKTNLDYWVSYIAYFFDIYFTETLQIIQEHSYVEKIVDRIPCENIISNERMQELKNHVIKYIMNRVTKASKK